MIGSITVALKRPAVQGSKSRRASVLKEALCERPQEHCKHLCKALDSMCVADLLVSF